MTRHDEIFELGDLVLQRGTIMLWTWQHGDVGATPGSDGDLDRALGSITARAVVMPAEKDLCSLRRTRSTRSPGCRTPNSA